MSRQGSGAALNVEMLGTRGLPNNYGGSETCVEEVGVRLLDRGHRVRVFCRPRNTGVTDREYRGLLLVPMWSPKTQTVDTLSHSICAVFWLWATRKKTSTTVLHFHGAGNGAVIPIASLLGFRSVLTVDGADWRRSKWSPLARRLMKVAARLGTRWADVIVADSAQAQSVYRVEFGSETEFIPYGAPLVEQIEGGAPCGSSHVPPVAQSEGYLVFVGRLVPEKDVLTLVRAHRRLRGERPHLVIVGGGDETSSYEDELRSEAPTDCHFIGRVFGDELGPVLYGATGYVQPSKVEGTSPMLLTAMAHQMAVAASDIPENRETVGERGIYFRPGDVESCMSALEELTLSRDRDVGVALRERVMRIYDWEAVTDQYERAYYSALES